MINISRTDPATTVRLDPMRIEPALDSAGSSLFRQHLQSEPQTTSAPRTNVSQAPEPPKSSSDSSASTSTSDDETAPVSEDSSRHNDTHDDSDSHTPESAPETVKAVEATVAELPNNDEDQVILSVDGSPEVSDKDLPSTPAKDKVVTPVIEEPKSEPAEVPLIVPSEEATVEVAPVEAPAVTLDEEPTVVPEDETEDIEFIVSEHQVDLPPEAIAATTVVAAELVAESPDESATVVVSEEVTEPPAAEADSPKSPNSQPIVSGKQTPVPQALTATSTGDEPQLKAAAQPVTETRETSGESKGAQPTVEPTATKPDASQAVSLSAQAQAEMQPKETSVAEEENRPEPTRRGGKRSKSSASAVESRPAVDAKLVAASKELTPVLAEQAEILTPIEAFSEQAGGEPAAGETSPEAVTASKAENASHQPATDRTAHSTRFAEKLLTGGAVRREGASDMKQIDQARFVQRVAGAFARAQQRDGEIRLRLSPPELGSLKLQIKIEEGAMTARLEAETSAARGLLLENLPALRDRLAEQNIRIERFDVEVQQQQTETGTGHRQHDGHQPSGQPGRRDSTGQASATVANSSGQDISNMVSDKQINIVV